MFHVVFGTYLLKTITVLLKFKFNWGSYILSGNSIIDRLI